MLKHAARCDVRVHRSLFSARHYCMSHISQKLVHGSNWATNISNWSYDSLLSHDTIKQKCPTRLNLVCAGTCLFFLFVTLFTILLFCMLIYIIPWHFYRWDPYLFCKYRLSTHTDQLNWCWHILPMPYMQVMNEWMLVMGRCFLKHWMMLSVILLKDKRSIFDWTMPHWSGHAYTIWPLGMLISNCSHSLSLFCQHYAYHLWLEAGTLTKSGCWSPGHDNLCCMSLRFSLSHFPVSLH